MKRPAWFPDWTGYTCLIVASGPSATDEDLSPYCGRSRVIAINESIRLAPWGDVLFGADHAWWRQSDGVGFDGFSGLRVTIDRQAADEWGLYWVEARKGDPRIHTEPGVIGGGGNSGFYAVNLAQQFGARRLILVGFDMSLERGVHWHGRHPAGMNNPRPDTIGGWRRELDNAGRALADAGVSVVNASAHSALTAYPKMSLAEAFA